MNKFYVVAMLTLLGSCADRNTSAVVVALDGKDGSSCSVSQAFDESLEVIIGAKVSCTDGSYSIILNGATGSQGVQGVQGEQGVQGVIGQTGAAARACQVYRTFNGAFLQCPNQFPVLIKDGKDGDDGKSCSVKQLSNGARITCGNKVAYVYNGVNGTNGTSCSVSNVTDGINITCGNTSQIVYDGRNGTNGLDGSAGPQGEIGATGETGPQGQPGTNALANAIGIAGYIYPCGQEFPNDEIFLRLTDGKILALYDGGPHEDRLVLLAPGNYITTDRNRNHTCNFTVTNNLQITNERVR